jgi:hypothetical protein
MTGLSTLKRQLIIQPVSLRNVTQPGYTMLLLDHGRWLERQLDALQSLVLVRLIEHVFGDRHDLVVLDYMCRLSPLLWIQQQYTQKALVMPFDGDDVLQVVLAPSSLEARIGRWRGSSRRSWRHARPTRR